MTFASRRFEVKANPWGNLGTPGLANLSDLMPDDDERLKWIHTNYKRGQASFNPYTNEFFPNFGQHDMSMSGGDMMANGQRIPIPRISSINEGMLGGGNSNNCPTGFYQFGQVCVPSVDVRGGSGSDLAGQPGTYFGKGDARGIINAITPPQFTAKNQEFIVLTDMQNIGGQPAKFYTRITIPELNITDDVSNSTMVMPLAKTKIGHRVIMPLTVASNNLLNAKVDLIRIPISGNAETLATNSSLVDDTGTVAIPSPNYRGAIPGIGGGLFGAPNSGFPMMGPNGRPILPPPPGGFPGGGYPPGFPMPPGGPPFLPPPSGPIYPGPFPPMGGPATLMISPLAPVYPVGSKIHVSASGFRPGEKVSVQIYSIYFSTGLMKYHKRLVNKSVRAVGNGVINPVEITIPNTHTQQPTKLSVIAYGLSSSKKAEQLITAIGGSIPTPGTGGGGFGGMFPDLGGLFDNIFDRVNDRLDNIPGGGAGSGAGQGRPNFPPGFPFQNNNPFGGGFPFGGGGAGAGGGGGPQTDDIQDMIDDLISRGASQSDIQAFVNQLLGQLNMR